MKEISFSDKTVAFWSSERMCTSRKVWLSQQCKSHLTKRSFCILLKHRGYYKRFPAKCIDTISFYSTCIYYHKTIQAEHILTSLIHLSCDKKVFNVSNIITLNILILHVTQSQISTLHQTSKNLKQTMV